MRSVNRFLRPGIWLPEFYTTMQAYKQTPLRPSTIQLDHLMELSATIFSVSELQYRKENRLNNYISLLIHHPGGQLDYFQSILLILRRSIDGYQPLLHSMWRSRRVINWIACIRSDQLDHKDWGCPWFNSRTCRTRASTCSGVFPSTVYRTAQKLNPIT